MSLLRYARLTTPRLHASRRILGVAFNSTSSSSSASMPSDKPNVAGASNIDIAEVNKILDFLSADALPAGQSSTSSKSPTSSATNPADDAPPTAPPPAYPSPKPALPRTNPMSGVGRDGVPLQARTNSSIPNPIYSIHIRASKRNTIATFTRPNGGIISTYTGGNAGFKKGNRSSYEAGFQCAMKTFVSVRKLAMQTGGKMAIHMYLSGFGNGRDAVFRALMAQEGEDVRQFVTQVTDKTPIKIGGTRAMKARRL